MEAAEIRGMVMDAYLINFLAANNCLVPTIIIFVTLLTRLWWLGMCSCAVHQTVASYQVACIFVLTL